MNRQCRLLLSIRLLAAILLALLIHSSVPAEEERPTSWKTQVDGLDAQGDVDPARGKTVLDVFDWSQKAAEIWRGSNTTARRQILDSICLNRQVSDVTLVTTKRKPFDFWVERLDLKKSRLDCQAFEPLITAFIDVFLQPAPYLRQIQRITTRMNPGNCSRNSPNGFEPHSDLAR